MNQSGYCFHNFNNEDQNDSSFQHRFIQPLIQVSNLAFSQLNNVHPFIPIDLSGKQIPPSLRARSPFSLKMEFGLTDRGKTQYARQSSFSLICHAQAFVKPLSPTHRDQPGKSSTSVIIHDLNKKYQTELEALTLDVGIYSLQILVLLTNLKSSPIFLEIPAFQAI